MKKVRLTEDELLSVIKKIIKETEDDIFVDDEERFTVEPDIPITPREKQIKGLFGRYEDQIPNDILRYMRKNPQLIMNRLVKFYGDEFMKYANKAYQTYKRNI